MMYEPPRNDQVPGPYYPDHCLDCPELQAEDYPGGCRGRCAACVSAARCMREYGSDPYALDQP